MLMSRMWTGCGVVDMAIDYERMKKQYPKQRARLTRALNVKNQSLRQDKVFEACIDAVHEWNEIGAWPDEWSRWQRALDDQFPIFGAPRLEEL